MTERWAATNSARVRLPFSRETRRLLDDVRAGRVKAYGGIFSGVMVRALWRASKTQTSRAKPWPVKAGDLVYVREAHAIQCAYPDCWCSPTASIEQDLRDAADGHRPTTEHRIVWLANGPAPAGVKGKPSIHMRREFARLLLRMTHDPYQKPIATFDAEDVLREGCPIPSDDPEMPGASWDDVWQHVNGERASESSAVPWVHRFEICR